VAVRSYRDHFGACKAGVQGFVVTGDADADATFAIAALAGMLPHPSRAVELETMPWLGTGITADLTGIAELVNKIDVEPIKYVEELPKSFNGCVLLTWQAMKSGVNDRSAFHAGVDRWRLLTGARPPTHMIAAAGAEEADRIEAATHPSRISSMGKVTLVECTEWGFDVWYNRHSPCVVWMKPDGEIDIGCRDDETAVQLFGDGGLRRTFDELNKITGDGWGGRAAICGGPRGQKRTWDEGVEIALMLQGKIAERL
jgi:hypothetical protein